MRLFTFTFLLLFCIHNTLYAETMLEKDKKELLDKDLSGIARGFIWDIPKTIILEEEKGTFVGEEGNILFYVDIINKKRATIGYEFLDNKLWRIKIFNEHKHKAMQEYISDLIKVQQQLTERFGTPIVEDMEWKDQKEKDFPDSWGWAVYRGELLFKTIWIKDDTQITAFLGAKQKYEPEMSITYENIKTKKQQEALRSELTLFNEPISE